MGRRRNKQAASQAGIEEGETSRQAGRREWEEGRQEGFMKAY
jgi:hypothetical protein